MPKLNQNNNQSTVFDTCQDAVIADPISPGDNHNDG